MEIPVSMPRFNIDVPPPTSISILIMVKGKQANEVFVPFSREEINVLQNARLVEILLQPSMLQGSGPIRELLTLKWIPYGFGLTDRSKAFGKIQATAKEIETILQTSKSITEEERSLLQQLRETLGPFMPPPEENKKK